MWRKLAMIRRLCPGRIGERSSSSTPSRCEQHRRRRARAHPTGEQHGHAHDRPFHD